MRGRIPDDVIDKIREDTAIEQVVGHFLTLTRKGGSYWARCPFHNEKTPSFHVNTERQIFYCFGCQRGGNVFRFLMDKEGMSFPESVEWCADRLGIDLQRSVTDREDAGPDPREGALKANAWAEQWFAEQLHGPEGQQARAYVRERGIAPETIESFALGWAPADGSRFLQAAEEAKVDVEALFGTSLARRSEGRPPFAYFRSRLIFPIRGVAQKVYGFGGRILGPGEPKYLNTPETSVFRKRQTLYALPEARSAMVRARKAFSSKGTWTRSHSIRLAGRRPWPRVARPSLPNRPGCCSDGCSRSSWSSTETRPDARRRSNRRESPWLPASTYASYGCRRVTIRPTFWPRVRGTRCRKRCGRHRASWSACGKRSTSAVAVGCSVSVRSRTCEASRRTSPIPFAPNSCWPRRPTPSASRHPCSPRCRVVEAEAAPRARCRVPEVAEAAGPPSAPPRPRVDLASCATPSFGAPSRALAFGHTRRPRGKLFAVAPEIDAVTAVHQLGVEGTELEPVLAGLLSEIEPAPDGGGLDPVAEIDALLDAEKRLSHRARSRQERDDIDAAYRSGSDEWKDRLARDRHGTKVVTPDGE